MAAILLAAGLAATMGMNAYGGMLSVLTGIDSVKRIKPTRQARVITIVVLTVVWYVIGESISAIAVNTVLNSLTLMLYLLVPWTAASFKYTGPVAKHISGVDISWLVGVAVAGIAYWLLARSLNVRDEEVAIDASEQQLSAAT